MRRHEPRRENLLGVRLSLWRIALLFLLWYGQTVSCLSTLSMDNVRFRSATLEDVAKARKLIVRAKMNPFSITQDHLMVAYDDNDNKESENSFLGFGQVRPLDETHVELASLYVVPKCRGLGVGTKLIETLLQRHDDKYSQETAAPSVCLLTIRPTVGLYEKFGFTEVKDMETMPLMIQLEYKAGDALSKLLGNELVCMERGV